MSEITTVGIDLAKNVFQVPSIDASGAGVVGKAIRRVQVLRFFEALPQCLVGREACAASHETARANAALGHEVRLLQPQDVKACVTRNKNDAAKLRNAVAIVDAGRDGEIRYIGEIDAAPASMKRLIGKLATVEHLHFGSDAGLTAYGLHRLITGLGHNCKVVAAPSLISRKPGEGVGGAAVA